MMGCLFSMGDVWARSRLVNDSGGLSGHIIPQPYSTSMRDTTPTVSLVWEEIERLLDFFSV